MKQATQLRLGHRLTMTPHLQQAIRLLQLSTGELRLEIQQALESNLMLELPEDNESMEDASTLHDSDEMDNPRAVDLDSASPDGAAEIADGDTWQEGDGAVSYGPNFDDDERDYDAQDLSTETLREHLLWQMRMTPFTETDRAIALEIIDAVNDDGYLTSPLEEILADLRGELDEEMGVKLKEIEAVLHRVQQFDPAGVAARDLRECLLIQLQQYDAATPLLDEAKRLVSHHLDLLASRDHAQLMRHLRLTESELRGAIDLIQLLNPRPGGQITSARPQYIVPDVYVRKHKGAWRVGLNPAASPRLRIHAHYASLIYRAGHNSENEYLKSHLQEARWLIKSLKSRNETLLKVATCIVERQRAFLEYGEEAMKPMILQHLAADLDLHESTISRITTQKYMHTPRGIFELKYFFSSHISTTFGEDCSATAIRALIKRLVSAEEPVKPLSDSKIASILLKQGINIARRTVAKYRESMAIPPSNERKRLA